jgi:6-phosphogluconolactonase (cycloisomerase 2 family)
VTLEDALTFTPEYYERRATCERVITAFAKPEPGQPNPGSGTPLAPARFAYVVNQGIPSTVTAFTVNQTTGVLSAIGTVPAGSSSVDIVATPSGKFVYVSNLANDISAYAIDANTGALTSIGTFAVGDRPFSIAMHPSGRFVYTTNETSRDVSILAVNPSTGALTSVGARAVTLPDPGAGPVAMAIHPSGRFGYVGTGLGAVGVIEAFSIDLATGALTSLGTVPLGRPFPGDVDPSGRFLFFPSVTASAVAAFAIDGTTGLLTSRGISSIGTLAISTRVSPSGRFTYTASNAGNTVTTHAIDAATGALTLVGTVSSGGTNPVRAVPDPSGRFVYALNTASGTLGVFDVDQTTGGLSLRMTLPTATPRAMAFVR